MERITSRQNQKIQLVCSLKKRSERQNARAFFFEGIHLLEEYLKFADCLEYVFVTSDALEKVMGIFEKNGRSANCVYEVIPSVYEKITEEKAPQGVLCVSRFLDSVKQAPPVKGSIILENLQDNGNVGTIIRTAASLGIPGICLSKSCADIYAPKTVRATMGALFSSEIHISDSLPDDIQTLRKGGGRVYAALLNESSQKLDEMKIDPACSFVIGNEGGGVSEQTATACDGGVYIPMSGKTESLNASAAAAIILWEMRKSNNGQ